MPCHWLSQYPAPFSWNFVLSLPLTLQLLLPDCCNLGDSTATDVWRGQIYNSDKIY